MYTKQVETFDKIRQYCSGNGETGDGDKDGPGGGQGGTIKPKHLISA